MPRSSNSPLLTSTNEGPHAASKAAARKTVGRIQPPTSPLPDDFSAPLRARTQPAGPDRRGAVPVVASPQPRCASAYITHAQPRLMISIATKSPTTHNPDTGHCAQIRIPSSVLIAPPRNIQPQLGSLSA